MLKPTKIRALLIGLLIAALAFPSSLWAGSDFTVESILATGGGRQAIIRLKVEYPYGGGTKTNIGTAFFVSENGYALTANHLFHLYSIPSARYIGDIDGLRISGAVSSSGQHEKRFRRISGDDTTDLALIRLEDVDGIPTDCVFAEVAFDEIPPEQSTLTVCGYPDGEDLQCRPGPMQKFRDTALEFRVPVSNGMSGSPIYSSNGIVAGIISGGVGESGDAPVNFGPPMRLAAELLKKGGIVNGECEPYPWLCRGKKEDRSTAAPPVLLSIEKKMLSCNSDGPLQLPAPDGYEIITGIATKVEEPDVLTSTKYIIQRPGGNITSAQVRITCLSEATRVGTLTITGRAAKIRDKQRFERVARRCGQ